MGLAKAISKAKYLLYSDLTLLVYHKTSRRAALKTLIALYNVTVLLHVKAVQTQQTLIPTCSVFIHPCLTSVSKPDL